MAAWACLGCRTSRQGSAQPVPQHRFHYPPASAESSPARLIPRWSTSAEPCWLRHMINCCEALVNACNHLKLATPKSLGNCQMRISHPHDKSLRCLRYASICAEVQTVSRRLGCDLSHYWARYLGLPRGLPLGLAASFCGNSFTLSMMQFLSSPALPYKPAADICRNLSKKHGCSARLLERAS